MSSIARECTGHDNYFDFSNEMDNRNAINVKFLEKSYCFTGKKKSGSRFQISMRAGIGLIAAQSD